MIRRLRPVAALLLAAAAVVSCGGDVPTTAPHRHSTALVAGAPDRMIAGPQGRVAQFVVECSLAHTAPDDPIVHPGRPGASHDHAFFGSTATDAHTSAQDLLGTPTTCDHQLDHAAYWTPVLIGQDAVVVAPQRLTGYYRTGLGADAAAVQPYPLGLAMIAGSAAATEPQPVEVVAFSCGRGLRRSATPDVCAPNQHLSMWLTFPDCWDGRNLDSDDHVSHVAYSAAGACPADHPVAIPQLQVVVEYPAGVDVTTMQLASGGWLTGHGDFLNAWDPAALEREVRVCLRRGKVCGVSRGGEQP